MTDREYRLDSYRRMGRMIAMDIQNKAENMTGTELYAEEDYIPNFMAAKACKNMLERSIGFVCRSSAGRVVKLLQPYDSDIYTDEPENLAAQWGFVWSTDPVKALPFIALSTSPYSIGDCCTEDGVTYRSKINNNVFSPNEYPDGWELVETN